MNFQVNRFVIDVANEEEKTSADLVDLDFFLQKEHRKVILGTVRFPDGKPAPCAVVKFFKLKHSASEPETTSELEPLGHAIADESGQFLLGPVFPGEKIILKIFYQQGLMEERENKIYQSTCEP